MEGASTSANGLLYPRVTIQFCTQCKWMLRAAYFAQELLSTFSTSLGEVALQPSTGGTFIVNLYTTSSTSDASVSSGDVKVEQHVLWDRKAEGGFPETKELKRRVRNIIDPSRDLGHVDRVHGSAVPSSSSIPGNQSSSSTATTTATATLPKAVSNLQGTSSLGVTGTGQGQGQGQGQRKYTPMDIDTLPTPTQSTSETSQAVKVGKSVAVAGSVDVDDEEGGKRGEREEEPFVCRPGDEDCG